MTSTNKPFWWWFSFFIVFLLLLKGSVFLSMMLAFVCWLGVDHIHEHRVSYRARTLTQIDRFREWVSRL